MHVSTAIRSAVAVLVAAVERTGRDWTARGGGTLARSRFMALSGLLLSLLFLLVIVAQGIPNVILSPCP